MVQCENLQSLGEGSALASMRRRSSVTLGTVGLVRHARSIVNCLADLVWRASGAQDDMKAQERKSGPLSGAPQVEASGCMALICVLASGRLVTQQFEHV